MTAGMTAKQHEASFDRERNDPKARLMALALERLGVDATYTQRSAEQTQGYPAALVNAAKQAIAHERHTRAAYQDAERQAAADIGMMGLTGAEATYHLKVTRDPSWRAWDATIEPARRALIALGDAIAIIDDARGELNRIPIEQRHDDDQHQQRQVARDTRRLSALAVLQRLGV